MLCELWNFQIHSYCLTTGHAHVSEVNISYNNIEGGAMTAVLALQDKKHLKVLNINGNDFSDKEEKKLKAAFAESAYCMCFTHP